MPDLKILASHPVQYHVPFLKEIKAKGVVIEVGYTHQGTAGRIALDVEFGVEFAWDVDLLGGYHYRIFNNSPEKLQGLNKLSAFPLLCWALGDLKTPLLIMGWFSELVWLIWLLRILFRAPTLIMSETTPLSFSVTPKPRWRILLLQWLLQHTTINLYIGSRNRSFLRNMGVSENKLFHVPYSIDNARFAEKANRLMPERERLCRQYGLDPELPTFLFSGKLIEKKRPMQLLEAYISAGLQNQVQLLYVGEGELRPALEQRIKLLGLHHVHMLGFLNQTEMPLAYVLGELLCLVSDPTETWGLVVNEALACGRPIIVSDAVGCSPDLVEPSIGWITPLDNVSKLQEVLLDAYKRRADWGEMGEKGRKRVARNTFSAMAEGVLSALQYVRKSQ